MVINNVVAGISQKLGEIFGDKYTVYDNEVPQGMTKPCFFINWIDGEETKQIGIEKKRYLDILHFDITGFAQNDNRVDLNDMADKLYGLEYITIKDNEKDVLIRANSLKPKIEDGVLHFFIDFKIFIEKKSEETPKMENILLTKEVKKDG